MRKHCNALVYVLAPVAPEICMRLRRVSSGYVAACATAPEKAPLSSVQMGLTRPSALRGTMPLMAAEEREAHRHQGRAVHR